LPGYPGLDWANFPGYGYYNPGYRYNNPIYGYNYPYNAYSWGGALTVGYADPPDSPLQRELAHTLGDQATPEYAAKVRRNYETAMARVSASPVIAKNLGIKKGDVLPVERERETPQAGQFAVTMKDGREFTGNLVREDNDRLVLDTGKAEIEIRKSETTTITKGKAGK
jgi:hypothetical protein